MKKLEASKSSDIKKAAEVLKNGGVVIFPTDTVFGIGCVWGNEVARGKIYKIKSRPKDMPLPVLLADGAQLNEIAQVSPLGQKYIQRYWPGGLTIILKIKSGEVVGFRVPDKVVTRQLIKEAGTPIIGTSANFHGKQSVSKFKDLDPKLLQEADYAIGGECEGGKESTVVDLSDGKPVIVRQGVVEVKSFKLSIDTTKREQVNLSLKDLISGKNFELVMKQQTGSQALIPGIVKLLEKQKLKMDMIDEIEVATGPGSFTGTRVGAAVANALGFVLGVPVNGEIDKIAVPVYEKSKFD